MHFLEFKSLREAMVQSEIQEEILNWGWFILAMGSDDNWARRWLDPEKDLEAKTREKQYIRFRISELSAVFPYGETLPAGD